MLHRLCGPPSIPLSFNLAVVLPRRNAYCVQLRALKGGNPPTLSIHRLRRGLPGYLILFATHAFEPQRHYSRESSRFRHWCSSIYLRISPLHMEFHSPLLHSSLPVSDALLRLSRRLSHRLKRPPAFPLRPINPDNACHLRITAGCGT